MRQERSQHAPSAALRLARKSWRLLYSDSPRCISTADTALARARSIGDLDAEGWARLARGFHLIWYATPQEAMHELHEAQRCFAAVQDSAGHLLAEVGVARATWRSGDFQASLERVLPLRDDGMRILGHDERGMLLNTIAGCYSELGQSQQAFAYMYQALHEARRARSSGFDVVLYCNLAHELIQLGDYHQALSYLHEGLERCAQLRNPRLISVLRINRVLCLTNLDRAAEAMPDVRQLIHLPADGSGRGPMNAHHETLAIAVLRAGDLPLGALLVEQARSALALMAVPDEQLTLVVARAELLLAGNQPAQAAALLLRAAPEPEGPARAGLSLRVRCLYFQALADVHERLGTSRPRRWPRCAAGRSCTSNGRCRRRVPAIRRRHCRPSCCA